MKGKELQAAIIEAAHVFGWRAAHFYPLRTKHGWRTPAGADGKGWPDLVLVRDRVVYAEVKGHGDVLRPEQRTWLSALRMAGAEAYVWTPIDWTDGAIEEVLRRRGQA